MVALNLQSQSSLLFLRFQASHSKARRASLEDSHDGNNQSKGPESRICCSRSNCPSCRQASGDSEGTLYPSN